MPCYDTSTSSSIFTFKCMSHKSVHCWQLTIGFSGLICFAILGFLFHLYSATHFLCVFLEYKLNWLRSNCAVSDLSQSLSTSLNSKAIQLLLWRNITHKLKKITLLIYFRIWSTANGLGCKERKELKSEELSTSICWPTTSRLPTSFVTNWSRLLWT